MTPAADLLDETSGRWSHAKAPSSILNVSVLKQHIVQSFYASRQQATRKLGCMYTNAWIARARIPSIGDMRRDNYMYDAAKEKLKTGMATGQTLRGNYVADIRFPEPTRALLWCSCTCTLITRMCKLHLKTLRNTYG
jgi:hypothetical protein